jgi:hypothetical protein
MSGIRRRPYYQQCRVAEVPEDFLVQRGDSLLKLSVPNVTFENRG